MSLSLMKSNTASYWIGEMHPIEIREPEDEQPN
jgi:hypothetical protein